MKQTFKFSWIWKKTSKNEKAFHINLRIPNDYQDDFEKGSYLVKIYKLDFRVDNNEN